MAWYVKNYLSNNMSRITFGKSFISVGFNLCPGYIFIGAYVKPEMSRYSDETMFGELCAHIECHNNNNKVVFLAGDLKCR